MLLALMSGWAQAATTVGGMLTQSAHWTASQSPYLVQSDVVLSSGATLLIDPGVTVQFAAGANLVVGGGSLQAMGTAQAPIIMTSAKLASGQASKGDWGQVQFQAGSNPQSVIQYAQLSYGRGIAIQQSSPTLNYVSLQYGSGAAITVDLQSSPSGLGLSASNNDYNGILVPAGAITSNVSWGLVGIPYVVEQGVVRVGQASISLDPVVQTLHLGSTGSVQLNLASPAPAGGVQISLSSSQPSVATVPAVVTVAQGASRAQVAVSTLALGSTTLSASAAGLGAAAASLQVQSAPTLSLTPTAASPLPGNTTAMTVQLSQPAPMAGVTVQLSSSNTSAVTVPASLFIPGGASTGTLVATAWASGSATLSAEASGYGAATSGFTVGSVTLSMPAGALVAPGLSTSIPVSLSAAAPAGGLTVNLSSSQPAVASVPASITIAAGQTSANFTLTGVAAGSATVSASATGYQGTTLPVSVNAVTIGIGNPAVSSISLPAGISQTYAVTLSQPAPAGGVVVNLATASGGVASVTPASVTIPQGQTSAGVTLANVSAVAQGQTSLIASASGLSTASVPVTVTNQAVLVLQSASGNAKVTVGQGMVSYAYEAYVSRQTGGSNYSPNLPLTVSLSSSDPSKATVPATVTIPAGSYMAYIPVTGAGLTGSNPVSITASAAGYVAPATPLTVNVVTPVLNWRGTVPTRSVGGARNNVYVALTTPGAVYSSNQTVAANLPVSLSIANANPAGLVSGFYDASTAGNAITQVMIPAGSNSSAWAWEDTPSAAGSYQLQASTSGLAAALSSVVAVNAPQLAFGSASGNATVTVGQGMVTYTAEAWIAQTVGGGAVGTNAAVTLSLSSSDPSKVTVPATVTLPAGSSTVSIPVTGVGLTGSTAVTITASAAGYGALANALTVKVVTPVLNWRGTVPTRSVSGARNNVYVTLTTPGAVYSSNQTAAANLPVSLSIANANPAGLVSGFYDASTAGNAVTQVMIPAGSNSSAWAWEDTPSAAGSYQLQASASGMVAALSSVVTVSAPQLQLQSAGGNSTLTVGQGLVTYPYEAYVSLMVNGNSVSNTDAVTVSLACSATAICTVPASVTIPAGSSTVYFPVTGAGLGSTTVTATAVGFSSASDLGVNVVTPQLKFSSISNPTVGGLSSVYVSLYTPGASYASNQRAAEAMTLNLVSNNVGVVSAPATLTIPAGQTSSNTVQITGLAAGTTTLTVSGTGLTSATSAPITVGP